MEEYISDVEQFKNDNYQIEMVYENEVGASLTWEHTNASWDSCFDYDDVFKLTDKLFDIDDDVVYLSYIYTEEYYMGSGIATLMMKKMIDYIDRHHTGIPIVLNACPYRDWGTNRKHYLQVLINFYKKFGFVVTSIDNNEESAFMVRI